MRSLALWAAACALGIATVFAAVVPAQAATLGQCQTTFYPRPIYHTSGSASVTGQIRVKCSHAPRSFLLGEWLQYRLKGVWEYRHGVLHENAPGTTYRAYRVQAPCRAGLWRTVVHASTTDGAGYHQVSVISSPNYIANCGG